MRQVLPASFRKQLNSTNMQCTTSEAVLYNTDASARTSYHETVRFKARLFHSSISAFRRKAERQYRLGHVPCIRSAWQRRNPSGKAA